MKKIPIDMNKFELPIFIEKDSQYLAELNRVFNEYVKHLKQYIPSYIECIKNTERNISFILQAIESYYDARLHVAYKNINSILEKYIQSPYIVAPINENYAFRGISPDKLTPVIYRKNLDNQEQYKKMREKELSFFRARVSDIEIRREEMLHIPFDKRGKVATQRFSMPGIPCVYMGVTSFVTWVELGMPEKELLQVSSYKLPKDLQILNLCVSQSLINGASGFIDSEQEERCLFDYIEIFPLVIATSFKIMEMNRNFKSEYIISQLVMQVANKLNIDGVAYQTKRFSDFYSYPHGVNLAIAVPYNSNGRYWSRADEVKLTEAIRFSEFLKMKDIGIVTKSYINEIYETSLMNDVQFMGSAINYSNLKFSGFDNYMVGQEHYKFEGK